MYHADIIQNINFSHQYLIFFQENRRQVWYKQESYHVEYAGMQ